MTIYNFCSNCGSPLSTNKLNVPTCASCNISYYQNSKPTAGVLPVKDGMVLLSRRGEEPNIGSIDIIGGFLEEGEHPEVGAIREAKEETGLDIKITDFLCILMDTYQVGNYAIQNTYYIGEIVGGKMKPMDDVASLEWVPINKLPLVSGFSNVTEALSRLKKWHQSHQSTSLPQ